MPPSPYARANRGFRRRHLAPPPDRPIRTGARDDPPAGGRRFPPKAEDRARHTARRRPFPCGDAFEADRDADGRSRAASGHKAFRKDIPLTAGEIARYGQVMGALEFRGVPTPFGYAPEVGTALAVTVPDVQVQSGPKVHRRPVPANDAQALR